AYAGAAHLSRLYDLLDAAALVRRRDDGRDPEYPRGLPRGAGRGRAVAWQELRPAGGESRQQLSVAGDVAAAIRIYDVARCQPNRGCQQRRPRQRAVTLPGRVQPRDASGDAGGEVSDATLLGDIPGGIDIHVAARAGRSRFAIVECRHLAGGRAVDDEPAAADVPRDRIDDFQRERDGYRGTDVAPT